MRLLIISHTPHYWRDGVAVGWGPTVRELDYLAGLFDEVTHVAVGYDDPAPASAQAYRAPNVRFRPVRPAGGDSLRAKAGILAAYPAYARVIGDELRRADAVHVRCPANISLLALALLRRAKEPPYRWVKYAGNWRPEAGEPWFYGLQRRWLGQNRHRGVVTVNGQWPGQPGHVRTFYNPCLTDEEAAEGRRAAAAKRHDGPLELLFVGALNEGKGVGRVLRVALALQARGVAFRLRLLGDGPDRPGYETWARQNGLRDAHFLGWVPRAELPAYYSAAHFILLPSQTEGWPKVLSEAMAFGVVPVAAAVSSIPQILTAAGAGVAMPVEDVDGMAAAIMGYAAAPDAWAAAAQAGVATAQRFTYRYYQQAVAALFAETWGVRLPLPSGDEQRAPAHVAPTAGLNGHISRNGHHTH
jgi:glycosyltransferase involved in cell wall biosynthesis